MQGLQLWFYKKFKKDQLIHAIVFTFDKRARNFYRVPTNGIITIGNQSYLLNNTDFFLDKESIPTYAYQESRTDPINPFDNKASVFTAEYINTGINNHIARDILLSAKPKMDTAMLSLAVSVITLIAVGLVGYLIYDLVPQIQEIRETLRLLGGV